MSLPPLLRESDSTPANWQRRVRDLVNQITRRTMDQGPTASRPPNPDISTQYYDTTLGIPVWFDGTDWRDAAGTIA